MRRVIVACAQQQMRLYSSTEEFQKDLSRFLYMAREKGAQLVVFPALTGVMAASPRAAGLGVRLLKQADARRNKGASFWDRTRSALAGSAAIAMRANFRQSFVGLLAQDPASVAADYNGLFGQLARTYEITLVAGSAYLPDTDGSLRHRALVFGPDGAVLGRHDKMTVDADDVDLVIPGDAWDVVPTPAGRLGILLGDEALYPEAGRVLAYQGADLLVTLAAAGDDVTAAYLRMATMSQALENRLFALSSFLVGKNHLAPETETLASYTGKSGIYAPLELTPRYSGVMVEMGTSGAEGLLTAELDYDRLHELWKSGVAPVRKSMPSALFAAYLPPLYGGRRTLDEVWPSDEVTPALMAPPAILLPAAVPEEDDAIEMRDDAGWPRGWNEEVEGSVPDQVAEEAPGDVPTMQIDEEEGKSLDSFSGAEATSEESLQPESEEQPGAGGEPDEGDPTGEGI